jgi:hypothetical protein
MSRRPKPVHQMSARQFDALFQTEDDCIKYLVARRWQEGVICPRCGNAKVYALASGHHWQCKKCAPNGYRFSHLTETIFENTNKPLKDWFRVAHLMHRFPHQSVDHTIGQHVVGAVHTNTIEGFWSILKRGVVGTFHKVSKKYLHRYVAEFQFRYNNRITMIYLELSSKVADAIQPDKIIFVRASCIVFS